MNYLTYTNSGCIEICHNMIRSLLAVNVNRENIYVECLDKTSFDYFYNICRVGNTVKLGPELSNYQNWSFDTSSEFCKIVSWKWKLIKKFYNTFGECVFVDSDIFIRKNVEEKLKSLNCHLAVQSDLPGSKYCTGFMYFRKNDTCDYLINACSMNHADDQIVFNRFAEEPKVSSNLLVLDSEEFPNGHVFYKTEYDKSKSFIVHNNHMVGIETKIQKFKENGMWL